MTLNRNTLSASGNTLPFKTKFIKKAEKNILTDGERIIKKRGN